MQVRTFDLGLEMTVQYTMLFVTNDDTYDGKDSAYFIPRRETDFDREYIGLYRFYYNADGEKGMMIDDSEITDLIFGINTETYELVTMDRNYESVTRLDSSDPEKYVARSFINGAWYARSWTEFKIEALSYLQETGEDINNKYAKDAR